MNETTVLAKLATLAQESEDKKGEVLASSAALDNAADTLAGKLKEVDDSIQLMVTSVTYFQNKYGA